MVNDPVKEDRYNRFAGPIGPTILLSLVILLPGCFSYKEVVVQEIQNVELGKLEPRSVHIRAAVKVTNPNGYRIQVKDPDVDLYLNDEFVGKGLLDSTLVLERKSERTYEVPLHAELQGGNMLMLVLSGALSGTMKVGARGTFRGKAGLLRKRFPFSMEETIDLGNR